MSDKKPNQVADFFNNQTVAGLIVLLIPWLLPLLGKKFLKPLQMLNWSEIVLISLAISISLFLQWFFLNRYLRQRLKDFIEDQKSEENRKELLSHYDGTNGFTNHQMQYLVKRFGDVDQLMERDYNKLSARIEKIEPNQSGLAK